MTPSPVIDTTACPQGAATEWHARHADEVLAKVDSRHDGLCTDVAASRLTAHGPNAMPDARVRHPLMRLLAQFDNALIYVLLAAALAATLLGHVLDAMVILAVVAANAVVGFLQEGKAESALAAIRKLIAPHAQVMRDGQRLSVPVARLVPGDVVLLEPGDRVPADLRLLRARSLLIDEALLTGESAAARKGEAPVPRDAALGDRACMAYSGTFVLAGQGSGVTVATGADTELGRIGTMLSSIELLTTPLLRQVHHLGRRLALLVMGGSVLLFAFAVWVRHWPWVDALMAVVGIAVAVIPEGLPAVITITLAVGVQRMAARKAVIRRLPAVETLGATSVICTDKTGTLTRNEMTAQQVVARRRSLLATGSGYAPEGRLMATDGGDDADALADAADLLRCAVLCNDARLHLRDGAWAVEGDPMEGALLALAAKSGLDAQHLSAEWPRVDAIPFDAAHRFMATLHRGPGGETMAFVKGAPEMVLDMQIEPSPLVVSRCGNALAEAGRLGLRVLGFGAKRMPPGHARLDPHDLADGVEWLGLVGFIDPPRAEALEAIAQCRRAGIEVKMITGDHAATATAIARQLGLAEQPVTVTVTGNGLDAVGDNELPALVRRTTVFARTSPAHKLRIVRSLQQSGAIVAMTGDGVNDAPSLKQADVGVAMGIKGTEAAKEAAEMVLLDDNFASIVNAVHEGRTVYDNIRKVVAWTLPTNGGEVLGMMLAILVGFTPLMSAAQILWVNLVTSATLGLALAFEPPEPGVMARAPRPAGQKLLSRFVVWRVVFVSCLFTAFTLALFFNALSRGLGVDGARTLVVNGLVAMEVAYLFSVRYLAVSSFSVRGIFGTPAVLAAVGTVAALQLVITYVPAMNRWFATQPLHAVDLLLAAGCAALLLLTLEVEKVLTRRFSRRPA